MANPIKASTQARAGIPPLLLLAALTLPSGPALAQAPDAEPHWGALHALSDGYLARRRVPQNLERPVEERRLATTQPRGAAAASEAAPRASGAAPAAPAPVTSVWLQTDAPGLYQVGIAAVAAATGARANQVRQLALGGQLALLNGDTPVAWQFDRQTDSLRFAGERYETFYSDLNAYELRLTKGPKQNQREQQGKGPARIPATPASFRDTLRFEEEPDLYFNTWVVAGEPDADYWFWDYLWGGYQDQIEVALKVPNPAPGGVATLRVQLRGWTDLVPGDEHQVTAELNGAPVGSLVTWDGFAAAELVAEFDQALLDPDGNNTLTLRNRYAPGTSPGQFLDSVAIDYARLPVADDGQLWLRRVAAGVQTVSGFATQDILVIESPVRNAVLRRDVRVYPEGDGWAVAFQATGGADFLVVEPAAIRAPALDARAPADLRNRNNQADYLIVAPRDFAGTAEALAQHRRAGFGTVQIVWLDDIYKRFGAGRADPFAIGRFMQTVMRDWRQAPAMVMLLGKGSLDHKDRMGYGDNFLPVLMTANPWTLAASDARLVGYEDGIAPFGLGRLPIANDAEGLAYVDKLIGHAQQGQGALSAVMVADNPDGAGDFHANTTEMSQRLVDLGFDTVRSLYHPQHPVRAELTRSATWNEATYVGYAGHGAVSQLGDYREQFITAADAALLNNGLFPVFTALTCAAGDDSLPATRSLAAALVLNPTGGAIASLAPTGLSADADAHILGMTFIDRLFGDNDTIGGAVMAAKQATDGRLSTFMSPMYSVVGDPAARAH